jgi:hypothetical protein
MLLSQRGFGLRDVQLFKEHLVTERQQLKHGKKHGKSFLNLVSKLGLRGSLFIYKKLSVSRVGMSIRKGGLRATYTHVAGVKACSHSGHI